MTNTDHTYHQLSNTLADAMAGGTDSGIANMVRRIQSEASFGKTNPVGSKNPLDKLPGSKWFQAGVPDSYRHLNTVGTLTKTIFGKTAGSVAGAAVDPKQPWQPQPYSASLANCLSLVQTLEAKRPIADRAGSRKSAKG